MPAKRTTAIHRLVERCRAHDLETAVARVPSGWVVMSERQAYPGQCMLLPEPVVEHINVLGDTERTQFLADMALTGDALLACTGALRVNYALFGNLEPALHAHIIPRQADEPEALRTTHPWALDWNLAPAYSELEHGELKRRIGGYLTAAIIEG
jgi:diadenosine tetraphosphate (Ap4A) HIT family hydrolase